MTSILPTHGSSFYDGGKRGKHGPTFLRRLFRFPHMDFEFALWQMGYLLIAPKRVYRNIYYHKQTKNQWSRDDPAFILLQIILLSVSSIVWSFVYGLSVYGTLKTLVSMVVVEFLLVGSVISTFTCYAIAQKVEWAYAFDVHLQLFFLPLLLQDNWISLFIALPFLVHTELLLYPIALCIALFIASLFGFNISQYILAHYFQ
ncbi:hypothetical protein MFLAVUS_000015 [Mucor flavus]|uniref:UNC-50 family protein n=1 Tax=Mucor flavus TaxID=439312 RepID=A0ABP9YIH6_9FUNG